MVREDPTCHRATRPECPRAKRSHKMRSLRTARREQPQIAATGEKALQHQRPITANKYRNFEKKENNKQNKQTKKGISLVAQWLGFWAFTAMAQLQSLVWELISHKPHGMTKTTSSVQFSGSVVSSSLQPHGLQHARPPHPLPTPGVYSNSCPSHW